ncbi:alpha/beta fold hydrolase [Corynebacterium sphenisci]|uniref:alpha/beta fold hydrolase n=1 Tax=Corynebacterium sphenisci TaxID=191493 RepID=UPI00095245DF|nr:alpha/beta fold hydrolase [Corynebacterium sphenisci]
MTDQPTRRTRPARRILAAVAAAALVAGPATPAAADPAPALDWGDCPAAAMTAPGTECAELEVPRDYADPQGPTITLTISRLPATGVSRGAVAGNPGGPGGDALGMFAPEQVRMPDAVREQRDLIAVQPRGLRWSTPLECDLAGIPMSAVLAGQVGALYAACEAAMPGYAATITTENTARDLEEARKALGLPELDLYGVSYGSDLMSTYATLFPGRVGAMVLDSGVDPDQRWFDLGPARETWRREALTALFGWIADRDARYHLGTTPLQVYRAWSDRVNEQSGAPGRVYPPPAEVGDLPGALAEHPEAALPALNRVLPAVWRGHSALAGLTGGAAEQSPLLQLTMAALYSESMWPEIADRIATGTTPEPELPEGLGPEDVMEMVTAMTMVERGIICNDNRNAADPARTPRLFGDMLAGGDLLRINADALKSGYLCAGWPAARAAIRPSGAELATPPLILHYDRDSAVTGVAHRAIREAMGGELILLPGHGHGVLAAANDPDAVAEAVTRHYLG